MSEATNFPPPRRNGFIFHTLTILALAGAAGLGLEAASRPAGGTAFLVYLIPSLLAIVLLPLFAYRLYSLQRAGYLLQRDGLRLGWGLRVEDIPMDQVLWVQAADQLQGQLPLPWIRWPGCVIGLRRLPGGEVLEYLASTTQGMLLIATPTRIYVISPTDPEAFLHTFQHLTEFGSLTPIPARSVYPSFLLTRVWADRAARVMFLTGLLFGIGLFILVSLSVSDREVVALRLTPEGEAAAIVPAVQLFLIPILEAVFFTIDLIGGLFFYRKPGHQPLAYILWSSADFSAALFLIAVIWILKAT